MRYKYFIILLIAVFAALFCIPVAGFASILDTADSFAVLGAETVTNTGSTVITGNLGVSPGSAVTGFPPGIVSGGSIHTADAVALSAQASIATAYNGLAGMMVNSNLTSQDLGGLTLTSGVYRYDSSAQLTGTLTLDGQGSNNAYWVFQIGSTLTTASGSSVDVINRGSNDGRDYGVFWQIGSSATLGTTTALEGNILANESVTLNNGATILNGRVFARTGAVTLDNNVISNVCPNGGPGYNGTLYYEGDSISFTPVSPSAVPEPSSMLLLGIGLLGLKFKKLRFKKSKIAV